MNPILDFLSAFTTVSAEEREAMTGIIYKAKLKRRELLHRQGDIPKRVAFILKGAVRAYYTDEAGTEHTVAFKFGGQPLMAFDSFTLQAPLQLNAETLEPTELIWTSYDEFFGFLETFPKYEKVLRLLLSEAMSVRNEHMKVMRITSARERYEALCAISPEVIRRVPLKYIASYLGMALETLSRVRAGRL